MFSYWSGRHIFHFLTPSRRISNIYVLSPHLPQSAKTHVKEIERNPIKFTRINSLNLFSGLLFLSLNAS